MGSIKYLIKPYLPEDYQNDIAGNNVKAVVVYPYSWKFKNEVELADEAKFIDQLYKNKSSLTSVELGAIIGNARLEFTDDLQQLVDAYRQASSTFVGIRDMLDWSDDPKANNHARKKDISKDKQWLKGFEIIAKNDLIFDAFVNHHQIGEMAELAKKFPNTQILLSHMSTPKNAMADFQCGSQSENDRIQAIKEWQDNMVLLAKHKNVAVKLSGLFIPKVGWNFHNSNKQPNLAEIVDKLKPLIDFTIEQFGVERCMFGSHFAPDKVSLSFSMLYDVYREIIKDRPINEQEMLLAGNAKRIYRMTL